MPTKNPRMIVLAEVVGVGCLSLFAAYLRRMHPGGSLVDTLVPATLLLALACAGFVMKLFRQWSTRLLWEWIFVSAALLGGWILPRAILPGVWGSLVAACVLFAPLASRSFLLRAAVCVVGASGAALLLAGYIPSLPLWVLWVGFGVYDVVAVRMVEGMHVALRLLGERRQVITNVPGIEAAHARIFLSHLVLPGALIVQAGLRDPRQGLILLGALLIGSWYAMMRPNEARPALIVPWAAIWMAGAEVLLLGVTRATF